MNGYTLYGLGVTAGTALGVIHCVRHGLPPSRRRFVTAATGFALWYVISEVVHLHELATIYAGVLLGTGVGAALWLCWEVGGDGGGGDDASQAPDPGPSGLALVVPPARGQHDLMADLLAAPPAPAEPVTAGATARQLVRVPVRRRKQV